jgi:SAM-dependent methyltransferase
LSFRYRHDCRLCHAPVRQVLGLPDTPLANSYPKQPGGDEQHYPLGLTRCESCQHVQLSGVVDPEVLFGGDYAYRSGTSPVFVEHLREFAYETAPMDASIDADLPPLIVDIASNDGSLLAEYGNCGYYRRIGVDPAENLAKEARARGLDVISQFFTPQVARDIVGHHGEAHLVTALNVMAHVDDLDSFIESIKILLHPEGEFVFEVGYLPDVIERGLYRVIYHEHLDAHTLGPLMPFFARHGLRLCDAYRVPTQGGSIRCFVRPQPGAAPASDRLIGLISTETPNATDVSRLASRIQEDNILLKSTLAMLRAEGKTVAGYGAPAQLTTLCYALGIGAQDIEFIADDNPAKVGRFTPGTGIPIVGTQELYTRNPDAVVLFSGNFANEIMARHSGYKGEWIEL